MGCCLRRIDGYGDSGQTENIEVEAGDEIVPLPAEAFYPQLTQIRKRND
jgi:hypothetical protein